MLESLFTAYLKKFMPRLQTFIEKFNGKRSGALTYLYKDHLRTEYSPDNKWESTTVDTTYVAADFVSMDSPLPLKARDAIANANGKLPKIGISRQLKESEITAINVMEAQGGNAARIAGKLMNDPIACANGLDERNEFNFLYALSNGYVAIKDEDNTNQLLRLNYNYQDDHTFGASAKGVISGEDIKNVLEKAETNGDVITNIWIGKAAYDALRQSQWAKELVANYEGRVFDSSTPLPVPTPTKFDEAFADETNGVSFVKVNRSVITEENGVRTSVKPWNNNRLIFTTSDVVGTLIYGRLAEQTHPVEGVMYQTIDGYKLIARYRETNPLRETTTGQAIVAPVIENVDQIWIYDYSEGQEVNATAEAADTNDIYVTVWGNKYGKSNFVTALNAIAGINLAATATDADIITAVNKLSNKKETELQDNVVSYIVS